MSHVYRPYPNQDVRHPSAALLPVGGGTVPIVGPSPIVARTPYWPESWTPQPLICNAAQMMPAGAAYVFAGSKVVPQSRPDDRLTWTSGETAAILDDTVLIVIPDPVAMAQAVYDRPPPVYQIPTIPIAALATPLGASYIFRGLTPLQVASTDYPNQEPLTESLAPFAVGPTYIAPPRVTVSFAADYPQQDVLGGALAPLAPAVISFAFNGLVPVRIAPLPDYPNQEPIVESIAPMATPAGAAYVFTGRAPIPQARIDERLTWTSVSTAALLDDTVLIVIPDAVAMAQASFERPSWTYPFSEPPQAALLASVPNAGIPPTRVSVSFTTDYPMQAPVRVAPITTPAAYTFASSTPVSAPRVEDRFTWLAPTAISIQTTPVPWFRSEPLALRQPALFPQIHTLFRPGSNYTPFFPPPPPISPAIPTVRFTVSPYDQRTVLADYAVRIGLADYTIRVVLN